MVTWIYDGDTVEVDANGELIDVRLVGINAPENDECYGGEALDYLIDNLKGEEVGLETLGTDQFGRTLANLFVDGENVGEKIVESGHAIAMTPGDQTRGFLSAEESARSELAGLWGTEICGGVGPLPDLIITMDRFEEVVMVTNHERQAVDISSWTIRDESSRHRFRFGPGSVIQPGGTVSIRSTDFGWDPGEPNVWNNDGDMAMLLDQWGRVVDHQRAP